MDLRASRLTERMAFVGRETELAHLTKAVAGGARLVLIVGDAGVGKTRFAEEGLSRAKAAGMMVVRGECLPLAGMLPLLPVASALSELAKLEAGRLMEWALQATPRFVREEIERLLPQLANGENPTGAGWRGEEWQRERLFAGLAELLAAVARYFPSGLGLLVEDVQWADSETLDFLSLLGRPGHRGTMSVVVTCRSDEVPAVAEVTGWLAQVRGAADVEEIRLGPLSRADATAQVGALAGGPVEPAVADELFVRAEGNPFFTEQLVAAAVASSPAAGGALRIPAGLPARLADVLVARAGRCAGDARAMLNAMAVAGRPVDEDLLSAVTGLQVEAVRHALRELAEARLLADDAPGGRHRPRNVLLAEAVSGALLPGERTTWHDRMARALAPAGDGPLAAEAAGHWQTAGRPGEEFRVRAVAGEQAERVFGYAEAASHWKRAIELWPDVPDAETMIGLGLPGLFVRAIDALHLSGHGQEAGELAEAGYRRFAHHPDPSVAAIACHRAASFRSINTPAAGRPLLEQALRLFEQAPPSTEHAAARFDYALSMLHSAERGNQADLTEVLNHALRIAEAAGASSLTPPILTGLAHEAFLGGRVEQGQAFLDRGRVLAQASQDGLALLRQAIADSDVHLKLARFECAVEMALQGVEAVRQAGLEASYEATLLTANAAEGLLAIGRITEAAALIDPLTTARPDLGTWVLHEARAEIDLLRGNLEAAGRRREQIRACVGDMSHVEFARESALRSAELALWAGSADVAVTEVRQVLDLFRVPDFAIFCGRLLTMGMWACADLAEQARARRERSAVEAALVAAEGLTAWADQMSGVPFTDHPFVVTIPAERSTWAAERTRLFGKSDPAAWAAAAKAWDSVGCCHRAGYAWWRQAQAQLDAGQAATAAAAALRAAAGAAAGHEPLLAQIRALADRARIPLDTPLDVRSDAPQLAEPPSPLGLTGRELAVLRRLATGRTNAQIGAELFISPRTAGVHVTNILRKLGVSGRVQAAALAERAGLLESQFST
jgi:DNA-binding CsgD family transcriptional regulator/tetratricopeptide (TPR) repeat protein